MTEWLEESDEKGYEVGDARVMIGQLREYMVMIKGKAVVNPQSEEYEEKQICCECYCGHGQAKTDAAECWEDRGRW